MALINALNDSESKVRSRAAEALGNIKDQRAVEPLIRVLAIPMILSVIKLWKR